MSSLRVVSIPSSMSQAISSVVSPKSKPVARPSVPQEVLNLGSESPWSGCAGLRVAQEGFLPSRREADFVRLPIALVCLNYHALVFI